MEVQQDEFLKSQNYNLKSPADFEQAQKHGNHKPFIKALFKTHKDTVPYSIICNLKVFSQHGYSYKYFNYIKLNFILLVLGFLIFGIYNIEENIQGNQCQQHINCKKNLNNYLSILNRMDSDEFQDIYLDVLYFIAILVQICFIGYITYYKNNCLNVDNEQDLEKVIKYCSLKVSQIPSNWNRDKIQEFFSKGIWEKKPITYNILDICLMYDQEQLEYQLKEKIRQEFTIQNQSTNFKLVFLCIYLPYIQTIQFQCQLNYCNINSIILDQSELKFKGTAFITFSNQADLIKFVRYFRWVFVPNSFKLESPPRPSDVIWYNHSTFSNLEYLKLFCICFGWLPIIGIQVAKQNYLTENGIQDSTTSYQNTLLSLSVSLLLYLLTKFCENSIQQFFNLKDFSSNRQKRRVFVLFYETIVIQYFYLIPPIFVGVYSLINNQLQILFNQLYSGSGTRQQKLWRSGGLSEDILFIQLSNAIFPIIFSIIDETYAFQLIKRYWFRRIKKDIDLTQIEANQLYERQLDYQNKRLSITQLVSICCYYGYIYPLCYFITILALIVIIYLNNISIIKEILRNELIISIGWKNIILQQMEQVLIFHVNFTFQDIICQHFYCFNYFLNKYFIQHFGNLIIKVLPITYLLYNICFQNVLLKREFIEIMMKRCFRNHLNINQFIFYSLYYDLYTKHNPIINHQFDQNLEEIQQLTRYSKQEKFYSQFQLKIFRELEQEYNPKDSARIHPSQTEIVSIRFQEQ